jgi:hypothetical protein
MSSLKGDLAEAKVILRSILRMFSIILSQIEQSNRTTPYQLGISCVVQCIIQYIFDLIKNFNTNGGDIDHKMKNCKSIEGLKFK